MVEAIGEAIMVDSVTATVVPFLGDLDMAGGVILTGGTTLTIPIIPTIPTTLTIPTIIPTTIPITMGVMGNRRTLHKG